MKSEEQRIQESRKIMDKYPDKVPIIVNHHKSCTLKKIDKNKYLVPKDITMSQFTYIIRKRLVLNNSEAIFIYINNVLIPSSNTIGEIYNDHHDSDGFLYVVYTNENTFG